MIDDRSEYERPSPKAWYPTDSSHESSSDTEEISGLAGNHISLIKKKKLDLNYFLNKKQNEILKIFNFKISEINGKIRKNEMKEKIDSEDKENEGILYNIFLNMFSI